MLNASAYEARGTTYPLPEYSHLARRVESAPLRLPAHTWTGNDRVQQHHHGTIRRDRTTIHLFWKATDNSTPQEVGLFALDPVALLDDGYVRPDGENIRLRFVRKEDGLIYIQTVTGSQALAVGKSGVAR